MAKVTFSKLSLKEKKDTMTLIIGDNEVEVKQYLPLNDKLALIENVLNQAKDDNRFPVSIKLSAFAALEILFNYTNISFTDKQKEDLVKLYDIFASNGIFDMIYQHIPPQEFGFLMDGIFKTADAIYKYNNSIRGIMEDLAADYNNLQFDAEKIKKDIADPNNLSLLKAITPFIAPTKELD